MDKKPEKLVPEVRFKGFTDDWEQRKLGDFGNVQMNKRIFKSQTLDSGDVPFYKIGTFGKKADAYISSELYEEYRNKYPYPKDGDLLISASGSIGKIVEYKGQKAYYQDSNIVWLDHDNRILNLFLKAFFQIVKWNGTEGSTIKRLYNKNILNTEIILPKIKEQTAVGKLIEKVDYLITLQQRKLEQLKQLKKAMLQQLFVDKNSKQPNLRFKNFNSDWKQRKLKNISKRILRKNSDLQSLLPLTISAQDGLVNQTLYFNKQVASKQLRNYLLLYNGDFAYNKSYSVGYPYGAIKRLDKYKRGVLSTLYIAFKPTNINSDFLQHYYDTDKWYREIYRNAAEGARNHGLLNISANDFFNSKLVTPSDNDEQLKIAKIINLFNHLITLRQDNLTQLTTLKKYLLQKLFI
ncbi:restriction endonuclease subunit S [Limosilactobacillus reuteri]|nr:restriction endonuclease subunit S [Limosilactobacillus reuteri]MDK8115736.1 restriction endonuclease subunit S [Limosilactobacillus reuteri]